MSNDFCYKTVTTCMTVKVMAEEAATKMICPSNLSLESEAGVCFGVRCMSWFSRGKNKGYCQLYGVSPVSNKEQGLE